MPRIQSLFARILVLTFAFFALSSASLRAADKPLRVIAFGAHPDDCELQASGVAAMWAAKGAKVKFVAVTNGDIGHFEMAGGPLAIRRTNEVKECARILGIEAEVLDNHDGELMPSLENRKKVARLIRDWQADIVLTHRPNDYHPDHRYTSILVQDAAFMVTVPFFTPDSPRLVKNPVFLYFSDSFQKPYPFQADLVVGFDDVAAKKWDCMAALRSQFSEWNAWLDGRLGEVPKDEAGRRAFLTRNFQARSAAVANKYRDRLIKLYGEKKGKEIKYAEAFELCEYGSRATEEDLKKLFPFFN